MRSFLKLTLLSAAIFITPFAIASDVMPHNNGYAQSSYTGPSEIPLTQISKLLQSGVDDQYVRVVGKIIRHVGGENFMFADASGEILVEIDSHYFPSGANINENTLVELRGEFDKEHFGRSSIDVNEVIRLIK